LARKSELLKARWQEIDFEAGEWQMRAKNAKNTMPHVVYLSRQAKALFLELKALAGGSKLVLPGRGSLGKPFERSPMQHRFTAGLDQRQLGSGCLALRCEEQNIAELAMGDGP
jgi:integrase